MTRLIAFLLAMLFILPVPLALILLKVSRLYVTFSTLIAFLLWIYSIWPEKPSAGLENIE